MPSTRSVSLPILAAAALISGCAALAPDPISLEDRLARFPTEGAPLERPVEIRWNEHQIPFVEAETDRDLAVALGMVHAHLRGAQMELFRLASQGRLSEIGGPFANEIDHALRMVDFGAAVPGILARMPPETRDWLAAFVEGINHYRAMADARPPESGLLGLDGASWTVEDVLTFGRMAGTDVNWLAFFSLLPRRDSRTWPAEWRRAIESGAGVAPDDRLAALDWLETITDSAVKSGSNSIAIAPERSASGAALLANDPHLGLTLPNLWLLAGMKSPSFHAVGMMIPGVPFVALGRSPELAWGGTNMRAMASDLYDVSGLPDDAIETRTERLSTRWWFDREVEVRESPLGPILSDSPLVQARDGEDLALAWVGREPSDEVTAFLAAMRATDPESFRAAFADYAVSAQNMVFVDRAGNIGQVHAARLPRRGFPVGDDIVLDGSDEGRRWNGSFTTLELPMTLNPADGIIVSANNRPRDVDRPLGLFYSPDDRVDRMRALAAEIGTFDRDALVRLQTDAVSEPARRLAQGLADRLVAVPGAPAAELARRLAAWDGGYGVESTGAVAFELLLAETVRALYGEGEGEDRTVPGVYAQWRHLQDYLLPDLDALAPAERSALLQVAAAVALDRAAGYAGWGEMHRLAVQHVLGNLPVIGGRFRFDEVPVPGSRETLWKSAHDLVDGRHDADYGAQSRHISDMADLDANWFVLLGGNDGWLGSTTFLDQVPLFLEGEMIRLPLRPETVVETFPYETTVTPAGPGT